MHISSQGRGGRTHFQMQWKTAESNKVILPVSRVRTLDRVKAAAVGKIFFGQKLILCKMWRAIEKVAGNSLGSLLAALQVSVNSAAGCPFVCECV